MSFMKLSRQAGILLVGSGLGSLVFFGTAHAAMITSSLDVGSRSPEVVILQTYLAQDANLYPQKLVTGYFGPLTEAAVGRFQCRENIVCEAAGPESGYGRVGPRTKARLNELIGGMTLVTPSGEVLGTSTGNVGGIPDVTLPLMTTETLTVGSTFATITWTTNEPAWSQVFYSASYPFVLTNALVVKDPSFDTSNGVTIGNLQPNTQYYYVRESADVANNVSLSGVRSFVTSMLGAALPGGATTPAASTTSTSTNTSTSSTSLSGVATTTSTSTVSSSPLSTGTSTPMTTATTTATTTIGQ